MIMIDPKSGRRLARAYAQVDQARLDRDTFKLRHAMIELREASEKLGKELMADNHHLAEGD